MRLTEMIAKLRAIDWHTWFVILQGGVLLVMALLVVDGLFRWAAGG